MNEREALQMGSLMHDIGKLLQRTKSVRLTKADRQLESTCCPVFNGRYSHTHVLYTQKCFTELWPNMFPLAEILAAFHHRPDTATASRLAKMVALADRLSSGERHKLDEGDESEIPRKARLHCLFSSLSMEGSGTEAASLPLLPLTLETSGLGKHFPAKDTTIEAEESYDRLWSEMSDELKNLAPGGDFAGFYTQIHHLMEKYTLFIPSAVYKSKADLSLFHHSKSTSAIATCLYDLAPSEDELDSLLRALRGAGTDGILDKECMWLVGADISGIQDFIYGIAARKALKGLKGRSVYLQLLGEAALSRLLEDFRLTCSNIIYCGGGHFYLIVPKTAESGDILQACQKRVDEILVRAHRGQLGLSLAWVPLSFRDFIMPGEQSGPQKSKRSDIPGSGFSGAWDRIGARLGRNKRARFSSLLSVDGPLNRILGPFPVLGEEAVCDVCGEPLSGPGETERCSLCSSFERLASRLARAGSMSHEVMPAVKREPPAGMTTYEEVLESLGSRVRFFRPGEFDPSAYLLNRTDFTGKDKSFRGFRFLARHTPMDSEDIVTLEELAARAEGIQKWGAVRADVDRLGKVFREGLAGSDRSISRVSMLSYLMSLYFSGHVEHLASRPPYDRTVSIVYAGGDDLFSIGSWSVLKGFSEQVYRHFQLFTAGRLTLSAGIFLAPGPGYPVAQAAKLAGEEEQYAKDCGRDRLAIFGRAIPWRELPGLWEIEEVLVKLMAAKAPRSLFSLLYQSFESQSMAKAGKLSLFPVWRLLYALRRLVERNRKLGALMMNLEQLIVKKLWLPEHAVVAVRLADYLTRQGGKGEE